ncbi:MAG: hypothetical protein CSA33_01800 [Desulfobulbus propionicus]|nr:MAG: hypothetical protein CSA33_01800 [Desulfobulbus propionicus]
MNIQWSIDKRRGNYRPTLTYVITLEEHELAIAMHSVSITSSIPRIPNSGRAWCMPGCDERALNWSPKEFHQLHVPYFKTGMTNDFIRLPFREHDHYPEVEASFSDLRQTYEQVVAQVYAFKPFRQEQTMDMTSATKQKIAATLTAQKMLGFAGL